MKKFLLIAFVIGSYILYGVHQRQAGSAAIAPPPVQSPVSAAVGTVVAYKDGQYTGQAADAYYGYIQVQVTIQGGKISDVVFLQYPHDRMTSMHINTQAMPFLKQEAIQAQSANVDGVSGATDTSQAFIQSLTSALTNAKAA